MCRTTWIINIYWKQSFLSKDSFHQSALYIQVIQIFFINKKCGTVVFGSRHCVWTVLNFLGLLISAENFLFVLTFYLHFKSMLITAEPLSTNYPHLHGLEQYYLLKTKRLSLSVLPKTITILWSSVLLLGGNIIEQPSWGKKGICLGSYGDVPLCVSKRSCS